PRAIPVAAPGSGRHLGCGEAVGGVLRGLAGHVLAGESAGLGAYVFGRDRAAAHDRAPVRRTRAAHADQRAGALAGALGLPSVPPGAPWIGWSVARARRQHQGRSGPARALPALQEVLARGGVDGGLDRDPE